MRRKVMEAKASTARSPAQPEHHRRHLAAANLSMQRRPARRTNIATSHHARRATISGRPLLKVIGRAAELKDDQRTFTESARPPEELRGGGRGRYGLTKELHQTRSDEDVPARQRAGERGLRHRRIVERSACCASAALVTVKHPDRSEFTLQLPGLIE